VFSDDGDGSALDRARLPSLEAGKESGTDENDL